MTGVGSGLIHFRCSAASHQQAAAGHTADTLTVHQGKWAYCPMDVRASGHEWSDTGGVAIEMLRRGSPTIPLDLDVRPHLARDGAPPRPAASSPRAAAKRPDAPPAAAPRKRTAR